jgi:YHS domain-containing protein
MNRRRAILALMAATFSCAALAQSHASTAPPVAIKGYDPVSYFVDGRAIKGTASLAQDFDDSRYHFSSAKNRELFAANPARYVPQFGGLCAAGLADGSVVESDPTAFVVRDGKLYLFSAAKGVERVQKDPSLLTKAVQAQGTK